MKRKNMINVCASLLTALAFGTVAYAGMLAGTGVVGSKHDMNRLSTNDPYQRVCAYCHTPHHAMVDDTVDYLPLWSHDLTTQTFTMYQSATLDAAYETDPLVGPSRLCMSCHDGVVAVDQHYNIDGTVYKTGDNYGEIAIAEGTNSLENDHPIGFIFADVAAVDRGINPPDSLFQNNPGGLAISDVLYGPTGIMTCATCHEVHNKDNVSFNPAYNYFLYAPEEGSQICLSCHDK